MRYWSTLISLCLCATAEAGGISPELQQVLKDVTPDTEISIIVQRRGSMSPQLMKEMEKLEKKARRAALVKELKRIARASEGGLQDFMSSNGANKLKDLWLNNSVAIRIRAALVAQVAAQPEVESVRLDSVVTAPVMSAATPAPPEWNLSMIKAHLLWAAGYTGQGVVIGSMDTGVDPAHQDLGMRWRGGINSWFDPNGEHPAPVDNNGHGTQTMGILVGGDADGSFIGTAPGAQWIAVKIFNDAGIAQMSAIHQGFQWMLDPDGNPATDDVPDIVNNSWGLLDTVGNCNAEFLPVIQAFKMADIAVVFSAGNDGPAPNTSLSPANYSESISVGVVDATQTIANFSSRGPSACDGGIFPRLVAPGISIKTADLTFGGIIPGAYAYVTGASFATAHVSGAVALLKSAHPTATVPQIEAALMQTALDLGAAGADNDYGWGLLDVAAASTALGAGPVPQPGNLRFEVAAYAVPEEAGAITITVSRTDGSDGTVSVDYATSNGTAQAGTDYQATLGSLNFDQGVTTASFSIPILNDSIYEGDESFTVTLANATQGAMLGTPSVATLAITDTADIPADKDGDGYPVTTDCNDNNPAVHPGAVEIKRDGIDQDCNGYDLTINIIKAEYLTTKRQLTVEATSALKKHAKLQVKGYGAMQWIAKKGLWRLAVTAGTKPVLVTVGGVEGATSIAVQSRKKKQDHR